MNTKLKKGIFAGIFSLFILTVIIIEPIDDRTGDFSIEISV